MSNIHNYKSMSSKKCIDAGMAFVLLSLIFGNIFIKITFLNSVAIILLIITMTAPLLFKPLAYLWFNISEKLGIVVSTIVLSLLFFCLVTPIGLIRRLVRPNAMNRKMFKKGRDSLFIDRNKKFSKSDLTYQY